MLQLMDLARKVNAVETIYVTTELKRRCEKQPYDFLLVLDFEATCWDQKDFSKSAAEVIEFPCVLYDVKTNKIVSEFQQYVMPFEKPRLSKFCTNLTGIQQHQVNNGVPIGTCLMLFKKWLNEQEMAYKISFNSSSPINKCIVTTWSNWDIGVCLKHECQRKRLKMPEIFNEWIDLRELYREHYLRKPKGLYGALQELGLEFEGNEHCGLHDARNTAKLAGKMIVDGMYLRKTTDIFCK